MARVTKEAKERSKAWNRAYSASLRAAGICVVCCKASASRGRACGYCQDRINSQEREQAAEWDRLGLCTRCGGARFQDYKTCEHHHLREVKKHRKYRERERKQDQRRRCRQKAEGLCSDCSAPTTKVGKARCLPCQDKFNKRARETEATRKSLGLCPRCRGPENRAIGKQRFCEKHYFEKAARANLDSRKYWTELRRIYYEVQKELCCICGERMKLAVDTWVEHLESRSKRPDLANSISNIGWSHKNCNKWKHRMGLLELVELCRKVVQKHSATS